jgi:hypothetical protein
MTSVPAHPARAAPAEEDVCARLRPLLSALARSRAVLLPAASAEDPVAIVAIGREDRASQLGAFAQADADLALALGWIATAGDGWGWTITRAGAAVLRAARARDTAARAAAPRANRANASPDATRDRSASAPRVAVGSLAWLHRRHDKDGQPFISTEQLAAGERLAADLWRARMTPRVTSVWTGVPGDGSGRRSAPGAGVDITDAVIAAKVRVERALNAVGAEFAGPLIDVCGHMLGLDDIERMNGLPTRSGKLLLRTALTSLARHYGYLPPEHGDAEIARRIAGWMAEDGAVTLEAWRENGTALSSPSPRPYGEKVGMRGGRGR